LVKIRLLRTGKKGQPHYRIVVADARRARNGKFIEIIGHYHPLDGKVFLRKEKVEEWLRKGAQPSSAVKSLLKREKVLE
jgi:small subunit ribosomal protein S16